MSKSSQITGLSKLSKSEKCVTFSGNIRASYLNFSLTSRGESDAWSSEEEEEENDSTDAANVQKDPNSVDFSNKKLEIFHLSQVQYQNLLKYLYLSQNNLSELPNNIFRLTPSLEWLDVRNNCLRSLPNLNSHNKIRTILAEHNKIERLPEDLHSALNLTRLQLGGNKISPADGRLLSLGLDHVRRNQLQNATKPLVLESHQQHRNSFDSGIEIKDLSETESETSSEESKSKSKAPSKGDDEAEEINDFIENKDLYCGKKLETVEDEFNFDDYLYCYKSFHSPFLDKEFEGFSLDDITNAAIKDEKRKKDQKKKKQISLALETLNNRTALSAWRDHYRRLQVMKTRSYEREDECTKGDNVAPPHGQDPDWSISNSTLPDNVFSPSINKVKDNTSTRLRSEFICSFESICSQ